MRIRIRLSLSVLSSFFAFNIYPEEHSKVFKAISTTSREVSSILTAEVGINALVFLDLSQITIYEVSVLILIHDLFPVLHFSSVRQCTVTE